MLVDTHCHIMPDRLALAIRAFFDQHMGWGRLAYPGVLRDDIVRAEADAGVARYWALPYAHKPGVAGALNEWMATHVQPLPHAVAAATFHPADPDLSALVDRAFEGLGLRVAKLHCSVGKFVADDPRLTPLWLAASARGIPIVVHAGHNVDGRTTAAELEPIARVAAQHPTLRLVIAHAGLPAINAALDLLEQFPALHADLTSARQWQYPVPTDRLEALADRLMHGSDCPNTTVTIAEGAAWIRALGLSPRAEAAILAGTAMRLVP
jgi:uncharacterized protein